MSNHNLCNVWFIPASSNSFLIFVWIVPDNATFNGILGPIPEIHFIPVILPKGIFDINLSFSFKLGGTGEIFRS